MDRSKLASILFYFPCFIASCISFAQDKPAKPISESVVEAGKSFPVDVNLLEAATQNLQTQIWYGLPDSSGAFPEGLTIQCTGDTAIGSTVVRVTCNTDVYAKSGEYRSDGKLTYRRSENGDTGSATVRMPIITIIKKHAEPTHFPVPVGASLALTKSEAFLDGAKRAESLQDSLTKNFPQLLRNTAEVRAFLLEETRIAKSINDLTKNRYIAAPDNLVALGSRSTDRRYPILFDDFDRRADLISLELSKLSTKSSSSLNVSGSPHLVLAQLPQMHESITVEEKKSTYDKVLEDTWDLIKDEAKGFLGLSESDKSTFKWSATTKPTGAVIWYSRLNEQEEQWAGRTNLVDQAMEYARWTFRFDWSGCSKKQKLNPFQQNPVPIIIDKTGCVPDEPKKVR